MEPREPEEFQDLKQLLPVVTNDHIVNPEGQRTVNARDLYRELDIDTQFSTWITRRIEGGNWKEGIDFVAIVNFEYSPPAKEYYLGLRMAWHLAMMERNNQKAERIRDYLLWCKDHGGVEKLLAVMTRAYAEAINISKELKDGQQQHSAAIGNLEEKMETGFKKTDEEFEKVHEELENLKAHRTRKRPSKTTLKILKMFTFMERGGRCPVYRDIIIIDSYGKIINGAEPDHWDGRYDPTLQNIWYTSRKFNQTWKTFTQKWEKFGHIYRTYHEELKIFCERYYIDPSKPYSVSKAWKRIFQPQPFYSEELSLFTQSTKH